MRDSFYGRARLIALRMAAVTVLAGMAIQPADAKTAKMLDIVDTISANPILTHFAAMIQASDLVTFLSSRGPFTIFVPTDSAFSRLSPADLDALLQPQNKERLQDILLFHVVNGKRYYAKDLVPLKSLLSCQGDPLTLRTSHSGSQFVLKSKIIRADIRCLNGVIHEVDTVLMPAEAALPPLRPPPPPAPAGDTNAAPAAAALPAPADAGTSPAGMNSPPAAPPADTTTNAAPAPGPVNAPANTPQPQGTTP